MIPLVVVTQQTFLVKWKCESAAKTTLCQSAMIFFLMPLEYILLDCGETTPMTTEANSKNIKMKTNMHCTFIKCYFQTS